MALALVLLSLKYPRQSNNTKETEHTASLPVLTDQSLAHLGHSKKNKTPSQKSTETGEIDIKTVKKA